MENFNLKNWKVSTVSIASTTRSPGIEALDLSTKFIRQKIKSRLILTRWLLRLQYLVFDTFKCSPIIGSGETDRTMGFEDRYLSLEAAYCENRKKN